jgi:hypothetical protein
LFLASTALHSAVNSLDLDPHIPTPVQCLAIVWLHLISRGVIECAIMIASLLFVTPFLFVLEVNQRLAAIIRLGNLPPALVKELSRVSGLEKPICRVPLYSSRCAWLSSILTKTG